VNKKKKKVQNQEEGKSRDPLTAVKRMVTTEPCHKGSSQGYLHAELTGDLPELSSTYSLPVISGLVPVSEGSGFGVVVCVSVGSESIAGTGLALEPARRRVALITREK